MRFVVVLGMVLLAVLTTACSNSPEDLLFKSCEEIAPTNLTVHVVSSYEAETGENSTYLLPEESSLNTTIWADGKIFYLDHIATKTKDAGRMLFYCEQGSKTGQTRDHYYCVPRTRELVIYDGKSIVASGIIQAELELNLGEIHTKQTHFSEEEFPNLPEQYRTLRQQQSIAQVIDSHCNIVQVT